MNDKLAFTLKAENLFDELYVPSSGAYEEIWMVGKPRTASVAFDFNF
jgi:hypothetical protein